MDFLSILEKYVEELAGKDGVKLLHLMKDYENISEFNLAEDLKANINYTRNLLYKLNSSNLVYSNRKKDRDKGLYIYYWTFNFKHAKDLLIKKKNHELNDLYEQLKKENEQRYYVCKNDGIRYELEEAMDQEFKCSECGSLLQQEDSTKKIGELNYRISIINQELDELKKPVMITPKPEEEVKVKKARKIKKKLKHKKVKKKVKHKKKHSAKKKKAKKLGKSRKKKPRK